MSVSKRRSKFIFSELSNSKKSKNFITALLKNFQAHVLFESMSLLHLAV
jgi:hypothetical protein